MLSAFHPTKRLLVETVAAMLESKKPSEVLTDEVLDTSGVSKGSMYHHFEDLQQLVETAQIFRYSKWIDAPIDYLTTYVAKARTKDERAERAEALAASFDNPRMAKQMGVETERLTDSIADVTEEVKNKGLFRADVNAKALPTFIQAYTLGKIVNDYNPTGVGENEWNDFIMNIVDQTFMAQD